MTSDIDTLAEIAKYGGTSLTALVALAKALFGKKFLVSFENEDLVNPPLRLALLPTLVVIGALLLYSSMIPNLVLLAGGGVCAVLALFFYVKYRDLEERCIATYDNKKIIVGTELTPSAKKRPSNDPDELLMDFVGKPEDVWTQESISRARRNLSLLSVLALDLPVIALAAVVITIPGLLR